MDEKKTIEISEAAATLAEQRAAEEGFESVNSYVESLIAGDSEIDPNQDWILEKINEGLASGDAGEATPEKIRALVASGIERAQRRTR